MSRRYIPQTPNNDFVYPNNDRYEYDEEIVHEINDNVVSGEISGLTLTEAGGVLYLQYTYIWNRNGAEVFIRDSGSLALLSVHCLAPGQEYFSAWRMIDSVSTSSTGVTVATATISRSITYDQFGLTSSWPYGEYTFEFRFIGLKQNYVVCTSATLVEITPTPTPTACACESYTVTNDSSESQATFTWTDCDGVPQETVLDPSLGISICACLGSITVTIGSATVVDVGPCETPTPTPTITQTATPTPSPTPSPTAACTYWYLVGSTQSGELLIVQYNDCDGNPQEITLGWQSPSAQTTYICAQTGSVVVVDAGIGTSATNTFTPCS